MFRSAWCGNSAGNWDPLHSVHLVALRLAALPFVASSSALHRLHPLDLAMTCDMIDMAPRWTQVLARSKICQPGEMPPSDQLVRNLAEVQRSDNDYTNSESIAHPISVSIYITFLRALQVSRRVAHWRVLSEAARFESNCGKKLIRKRTPKFTLRNAKSIKVHVLLWLEQLEQKFTMAQTPRSMAPRPGRDEGWSPLFAWHQDRKCYKSMIVDYCRLLYITILLYYCTSSFMISWMGLISYFNMVIHNFHVHCFAYCLILRHWWCLVTSASTK